MRKFQEGGFSAEQEEWLGGADRTDPYILARMRRAVPDKKPTASEMGDDSPAGKTGYGEENELPATTTTTRVTPTNTTVSKTPAKPMPKGESADEYKTRMESLVKKQGLTPVRPEEMLIGGGGLKVLQMAGKKLASKIAGNRELKEYVVPKLPAPTPKLSYDKAGDLASKRAARATSRDVEMKRSNAENYGIDPDKPGSASALESLRKNIGSGEFAMKKGGAVSSASKRADGCCIRGKTRA